MMTSDARKRLAERTAERLTVQVTVNTDELREWADRHADMGNHGVAHVLYAAAKNGETLTEQAIREAEKRGAIEALREAADWLTAFAAETYPEDVFPEPTVQQIEALNALPGYAHMRTGAQCYRRAIGVQADRLRDRADHIAANAQGGDQ